MIALATKRTRFGRSKDSSAKTGIPENKEILIDETKKIMEELGNNEDNIEVKKKLTQNKHHFLQIRVKKGGYILGLYPDLFRK